MADSDKICMPEGKKSLKIPSEPLQNQYCEPCMSSSIVFCLLCKS